MYAISLTSIPPRFHLLGPVLASLIAQKPAPSDVFLCLPKHYKRFPGVVTQPDLPAGVTLLWSDTDLGPATKALPVARWLADTGALMIYCDDDWIVPPDWAAKLMRARLSHEVVTGSGYGVDRLGRVGNTAPGTVDIAQGFSGVLIDPAWLSGDNLDPPRKAWAVDDIWLSGQLARRGIAIREAPEARDGMQPAYADNHSLQTQTIYGQTRDQANRACAELLFEDYGLWPSKA